MNQDQKSRSGLIKVATGVLYLFFFLISLTVIIDAMAASGGMSMAFRSCSNLGYFCGRLVGGLLVALPLVLVAKLGYKLIRRKSFSTIKGFMVIYSVLGLVLLCSGGLPLAVSLNGNRVTTNRGIAVTFAGVPAETKLVVAGKDAWYYELATDTVITAVMLVQPFRGLEAQDARFEILEGMLKGYEDKNSLDRLSLARTIENHMEIIEATHKRRIQDMDIRGFVRLYYYDDCVVLTANYVDAGDSTKPFFRDISFE